MAELGPTLMRLLHGEREVFRHNACLILECFRKVGMRYIEEIAELSGGPLPSGLAQVHLGSVFGSVLEASVKHLGSVFD